MLLELVENDKKKLVLCIFLQNMITFCARFNLVYVVQNIVRWK